MCVAEEGPSAGCQRPLLMPITMAKDEACPSQARVGRMQRMAVVQGSGRGQSLPPPMPATGREL